MRIDLITSLEDAQKMREIRNSVRQYMTRHTDFISAQEQVEWYKRYILAEGEEAYLYYDHTTQACVGYGYIRPINDKYWGSLAVKEEFQGKGFGTEIYKHMIEQAGELWIEIFSFNNESISAAVKAGFKMVWAGDLMVVLKGIKYDTTF